MGAEGTVFQRKDGRWVARVELPPGPDGKRRRKQVVRSQKAAAVAARREMLRDLSKSGDLATSSPTLGAWLERWLERTVKAQRKPRTYATYRSYVERYIVPSIGRIRLDKLTPAHVARLHAFILDQGLSSTTALQAHRILSRALVYAIREGHVARNVADRDYSDAPAKAISTRPALTAEQARTVLARGHGDDLATKVRLGLALLAGLRQGEALGITRDAVNLDAGTVTVAWQLQRLAWSHGCGERSGEGWPCRKSRAGSCHSRTVHIPPDQEARNVHGGLWLTRPKSRAGWREVPLEPSLHADLAELIGRGEAGPEGLLLLHDGAPIDPSRDSAAWHDALGRCGLDPVPLHSARHTTATLLFELGVDQATRQAILGHSSATTTAGYTHIAGSQSRDAMQRLGTLIAPAQIGR
jgi:integrase